MASNSLKTYSADKVLITLGAFPVTGAADGTFVSIEAMTDGVTSESGAYGDTARSMSLDRRHTITVTLQQTSDTNTVLSGLYQADRVSSGNGTFPVSVVDLRGQTLFAGQGWVRKPATAAFSKTIETREWEIEAVGDLVVGGNL
jgi:hypothetical protein